MFGLTDQTAVFLFQYWVAVDDVLLLESSERHLGARGVQPSGREGERAVLRGDLVQDLSGLSVADGAFAFQPVDFLLGAFAHLAAAVGGERFDGDDVADL